MLCMYVVIEFREVRIAIEVKRSDAGDISPVAMFIFSSALSSIWNAVAVC